MISISQAVQEIVSTSTFALEALQRGLLNTTRYAYTIQKMIEERCWKEVKIGTIVVALNRLQKQLESKPRFTLPKIKILESYIHNDLIEWVIEKNSASLNFVHGITQQAHHDPAGITISHGIHEMTVIAHKKYESMIREGLDPKIIKTKISDLAALTLKVPTSYTETPNIFFAIFKKLAASGINIIEIMSTSSEITLILKESDTTAVLHLLQEKK